MRLAALTACLLIPATLHATDLVDQEAIFARAREIAVATGGVEAADLFPFRIAYAATRLETGNPAGEFEVDLLIRSSRSVVPAAEVIAAAGEPDAVARLTALLDGSESAWHYRTIRVRFVAAGDAPAGLEFSTLLLNRDPEPAAAAVSSPAGDAPRPQQGANNDRREGP